MTRIKQVKQTERNDIRGWGKKRHDLTTTHACLQRSLSQLIGEYPLTSKRVPWFKSGNCQKTNEQAFQLLGYFHQLEQNVRPQIFYYKQLTNRTNSGSTMKGNYLLKTWRKPMDSISLQLWKAAQFGHHAKGDLALNQPRITHFCVQQSTLEMKESQNKKKKNPNINLTRLWANQHNNGEFQGKFIWLVSWWHSGHHGSAPAVDSVTEPYFPSSPIYQCLCISQKTDNAVKSSIPHSL
jgi:hypothetical protein